MVKRLRDRSTGDLLILMVTFTVCFSVLASGATLAVVAFVNPEADFGLWTSRIAGILNTMLGVMAGYLAGRTDAATRKRDEPAE